MMAQQRRSSTIKTRHQSKQSFPATGGGAGHRPNLAQLLNYFWILLLIYSFLPNNQLPFLSNAQRFAILKTLPSYYYIGCYAQRAELVPEQFIIAKLPKDCVDACVVKNASYAILMDESCFCDNSIVIEDRHDEQLCNTTCTDSPAQLCGGNGVQSYYSTQSITDAAAKELKLDNATENSLLISWQPHEPVKLYIAGADAPPVLKIMNYIIKSERIRSYSTLPYFAQPEFIVQGTATKYELTDLHPATEYNITVQTLCENAENLNSQAINCGVTSVLGTTEIGEPFPAPPQPRIIKSSDSTITVEIKPIRNDNGPLSKVLIIVERVDDALSQPFDTELLGSWQHADEAGLPYYIAAELDYGRPEDNKTRKFIVGDGKRYGPYTNPPINNTDTHWHVSFGVVSTLNGTTKIHYTRSTHDQHITTMDNFTYATFDAGKESLVALIVTCSIFGLCFLLSLIAYFYLRYRTCQMRIAGRAARNSHEMTMHQPIIERENNGFVIEDEMPPTVENFKEQLNTIVDGLSITKRIPRNNLRMNVNDILAEGNYGEVITGKLIDNNLPESAADCQLHVISLDELTSTDQSKLLQEFRNLTKVKSHSNILDFYGVAASTDWFYFIFEHQTVTLKRRLIESRRAPNTAPVQRLTTLSEQLVLQWIYEIASAMDYLNKCKVIHKHLCSHNVYVTADSKLKLSVFGPTPHVTNHKKVDHTRWLAPECLRYQHYSTKSDIWSFAVVAWECCSLGGTPYALINHSNQILDVLKSGSRPAQPGFVYQDLYQMLMNCWTLEPSERITFEDICFNIRQLMTSPRHALCFDRQPDKPGLENPVEILPYYMPMLEVQN